VRELVLSVFWWRIVKVEGTFAWENDARHESKRVGSFSLFKMRETVYSLGKRIAKNGQTIQVEIRKIE
jgi:hypothetical protein